MDKRLLDEVDPPRRPRGFDSTGNRILLSVLIGLAVNCMVVAGGIHWPNPVAPIMLTGVVAVIFYVVITLLARGGR